MPKLDEYDDEVEPILKENALKLLKLNVDKELDNYLVILKNPLQFWLSIDHKKTRLSFRQTTIVIIQHQNRIDNAKLIRITYHMAGNFVKVMLVVSLILTVLCKLYVWTFLLAIDSSTHQVVLLLGLQIWVCVDDVLMNLHV